MQDLNSKEGWRASPRIAILVEGIYRFHSIVLPMFVLNQFSLSLCPWLKRCQKFRSLLGGSYLAVTASQIQHHLGSTLSSKVLRTLGG